MTRPIQSSPTAPGLDRLREDVEEALQSGRFDRAFYDHAMRRVSDEGGNFAHVMAVVNAAVKAGVLKSIGEAISLAPTHRMDPKSGAFVALKPSA